MDAHDIPTVSISNHCVVLDLDSTLIATQESLQSLRDLKILSDPRLMDLRRRIYHITIEDLEKPGIGTKYEFWGVTRPHLQQFLIFCFSYFKVVAVWSAGRRQYVEAIVDHIFKDLPKPHAVFTYDDIQRDGDNHIVKPLEKMMQSHPVLARYMSLENTFAIDDNSMTFYRNPANGVLIPEYLPALTIDAFSCDDPTLIQLQLWLLQPGVAKAQDIRKLDKTKIFATSVQAYQRASNTVYNFM